MIERLVLGTAQLGSAYGVSNKTGKPSLTEAQAIVAAAWARGVRSFDTAQAYGDSEKVLGEVLTTLGINKEAKIFTKLNPAGDYRDKNSLTLALNDSLKSLKVERLEGLLLHHEDMLGFWQDGLASTLKQCVRAGQVKAIGVSFYTPQKALAALDIDGIDFIQIPGNILDQRFESAGVIQKAAALKKKVFIRSVFLQGLLLSSVQDLPARFAFASDEIKKVEQMACESGLTKDEFVLGYAKTKWPSAQILIGAETVAQIESNMNHFVKVFPQDLVTAADKVFAAVSEKIVNPTLWPK